ncbi:MAG TPA: hypothetical protein VMM82_11110 [Spirochaetia bacterium]|nr:hypothetical protein [Spirochaetia bacterium]
MKLTEIYLAQLEREAPLSLRVLQRVPEGKPDWKPHQKSMPLGYLAALVATMPGWIAMTITQDSLDLNPVGGSSFQRPEWKTTKDLERLLEQSVSQAREALKGASDEHLMTTWRLLVAGRVVDESPRHVVISDTFSHVGHHRGQLTVYLRLNEVPVPMVYGPTADQKF